ncbi:Protein GVQW1 [Plecturocebus cupreus]
MCQDIWLVCVCVCVCVCVLVETGFHHVTQAGLELLVLSDLPASAFQSAGITATRRWKVGALRVRPAEQPRGRCRRRCRRAEDGGGEWERRIRDTSARQSEKHGRTGRHTEGCVRVAETPAAGPRTPPAGAASGGPGAEEGSSHRGPSALLPARIPFRGGPISTIRSLFKT